MCWFIELFSSCDLIYIEYNIIKYEYYYISTIMSIHIHVWHYSIHILQYDYYTNHCNNCIQYTSFIDISGIYKYISETYIYDIFSVKKFRLK